MLFSVEVDCGGKSEAVEMEASREDPVIRCEEEEDSTVEVNALKKGLESIQKTNELLNGERLFCTDKDYFNCMVLSEWHALTLATTSHCVSVM